MSIRKKRNILTIIAFIIIFVLGPTVYFRFIRPNPAMAGWFNDMWGYRKAVNISNSSGGTLTDFQVSVNIGTSALIASGKMPSFVPPAGGTSAGKQSNCNDICITDTIS